MVAEFEAAQRAGMVPPGMLPGQVGPMPPAGLGPQPPPMLAETLKVCVRALQRLPV